VDWIQTGHHNNGAAKGNELMATAMIPISDQLIYLALGDSDSRQEELFWDRHGVEIMKYPRRILKVSHHGSKNSTRADFLKKVNPSLAVISVGKHNHYHHPHYSVMQELNSADIPIHRTDIKGDYVLGN